MYFIYLPIFLNFIFNLYSRYSTDKIIEINFYNTISTILLFCFISVVGFLIKELFTLPYISTGIVLYFFSFLVFDNIILFFYSQLSFFQLFIFLNIVWALVLLIYSSRKFLVLVSLFLYSLSYFFNSRFLQYLTVDENIIGDVKDIHYPHVKNIYEFSYFYSMNNPTLEGYPQLSAYVQSLLNMISLSAESFNHLSSSINVLFLLFLLLFSELEISKSSKYCLIALFSCLIFNSQWLKFLFIDSLMTEGVLSYLFVVLLISCLNQVNNLSKTSYIVFLITGLLYLGKQFFSTLALALVLIFILKQETRKYALVGLIGVLLKELRNITFFENIQKDYHLKEVDLVDTFFDLLLFRDLKLSNISTIFKNLIVDTPVFILFAYLFVMTIIFLYSYKLKYEKINIILFIVYLNFLLIFSLYITIWKTMELESPIRYMLNLLPVVLYLQFMIIDIFRGKYLQKGLTLKHRNHN